MLPVIQLDGHKIAGHDLTINVLLSILGYSNAGSIMKSTLLGTAVALLLLVAGCQTGAQEELTVADYCNDAANVEEHVCQVKLELDGQSQLLSNTSLSLSQARSIADSAQARSDEAYRKAEEARQMAQSALLGQEDLSCKTRVIRKTNTGTCEADYTLMSCSQTRFTSRAAGLSILREINDEKCRFQDRVLEMQVRCCRLATPEEAAVEKDDVIEPVSRRFATSVGY